jgi:hypothetical protein
MEDMMTTCEHNTAIILWETPAYDIALCTWGCAQHLVSVTDPDTRLTRTWTVAELIAAVMPPCGRCHKPTPAEEIHNGGGYCDACWEAEGIVIERRSV